MLQLLEPKIPHALVFHAKREHFMHIPGVAVKALLFLWSEIHLS